MSGHRNMVCTKDGIIIPKTKYIYIKKLLNLCYKTHLKMERKSIR